MKISMVRRDQTFLAGDNIITDENIFPREA